MNPIAQTILAGLVPAILVGMLLLGVRRRLLLATSLALPAMLAAFGVGTFVSASLGAGEPLTGFVVARASVWLLAIVLLVRALGYYVFHLLLERQWRVKVPPLLPRVTHALLYFIAALAIVTVAFPDAEIGPLLATSAVTSLVLGLALQPILTNFFAGVVIALERPFRINDWIQVGSHEGKVTSITWRTTHIRTRENDTVILPNASIAEQTLVNFLYPHPLHMSRVYVGVHYRTPPHRVRAAMLEAAARVDGVLDTPSTDVYVTSFDDSAITYELRSWVADMAPLPRIESELRQEIWDEFHRRGITIPFPIRTLEIAPRPRPRAVDASPRAQLFVVAGAERGRGVEVGERAITVGRDAGCDLVLDDRRISGQHFRVVWEDGAWTLRDLGSTHGTRVNRAPVTEIILRDLDRIEVADIQIAFEIDD